MAFDPDAYLSGRGGVGATPFDPDEYLTGRKVGTSVSQELSQLGPAFLESVGRPLENLGTTAEVIGLDTIGQALKGAITEPENYKSAAESFMEPQPGESSFLGFAWQYAPRAAVEQAGQVVGSIASRAAGAGAGLAVGGPVGAVAGAFVGPAIFEAAQIIGPIALERAQNNGREKPNNEDLLGGTLTALYSGALNAVGARYLPGGEKSTGKFFKRLALGFGGEFATETPQALGEQVGGTLLTEAGLKIEPKKAIGEGLIGGVTGAGTQAIVYPFVKNPENQVLTTPEEVAEVDIQAKSNDAAVELMSQPGDAKASELVTTLKEVESYLAANETLLQALEPNSPEAQSIKLENEAIRKEAARIRGAIESNAGLEPLAQAEAQQAELARGLGEEAPATQAPETPPAQAPTQEEQRAYAANVAAAIEEAFPATQPSTPAPVSSTITPVVSEEGALVSETTPAAPAPLKPDAPLDQRKKRAKTMWDSAKVGDVYEAEGGMEGEKFTITIKANKDGTRYAEVDSEGGKYVDTIDLDREGSDPTKGVGLIYGADMVLKPKPDSTAAGPTIGEKAETSPMIGAEPTQTAPAEGVAETAAEPAGPIGNRIKLGRSPQTYVVEEAIPQTEREVELGEQFFRVRNEKTGETQVVEQSDMKPVSRIRRGESGAMLIPTREDFVDLGQRIYEKGMQFKAWADRMIAEFGDAVRQFLGDIWKTVSGIPAKLEELAGYLPGKGEVGAVNIRGQQLGPVQESPEGQSFPEAMSNGIERQDKRGQVGGVEGIGTEITTPKKINAKVEEIIRNNIFNAAEVSDANTNKAWNLIQNLQASNPNSTKIVDSFNALTNETLGDSVNEGVKQAIAAAKVRNELFAYAMKLTADGDLKMLQYLLNNDLQVIGTGGTLRTGAQALQASFSMKNWIIRASEAEKTGVFQVAAQQFFNTKNPTDEQIQQMKELFEAVDKVKIDQVKELSDELEKVGKATGIDVQGKVRQAVSKASREQADIDIDDLNKEYIRIQSQAESQIERLAKIQSDTPSFAKKKANEISTIVNNDLKNTPDMGRKEAWKSMLVAKLFDAGVEESRAGILADIVWRQHEINDTTRKLEETVKAVEEGSIKGIVDAILNTPLAEQQKPEWRQDVIRKYLTDAGVPSSKADNIAKLFDISLRKRFAEAQEQAAEKAAKSLEGGITTTSKRAMDKLRKAIRAQVLDPGKDVAKAFSEQMGWKGFTKEQIVRLNELDAIVNDKNTTDAEISASIEKINRIIDQVSLPPKVKDIIGSYYVGNILGRFTTFTIQQIDPLFYTTFNAAIQSFQNITNPAQFIQVWKNYGLAITNLINETRFSFKNDVLRSGKILDYMERQDRQIGRLWNEAEKKWKAGDIKGAMKDGIFGYTAYTFRTLKALDDGAYSLLTTANLPMYVEAALKRANIPRAERRGVMRQILEARELDIKTMVDKGISRNDAVVYANERMRGDITKVLTGLNIDAQEVIDSALNDALSRIGKTRFSTDINGKETEVKDLGTISAPFLQFYENVARSVNAKGGSEAQKIFYRILFGFPLIPARIFNIAAGYTPLTIYRHALKKRYSLTYGTALQQRQRIIEQMAGTAVLLPLLFLRSASLDEEDEKEKGFGVYITGQGPSRMLDKETRAQWDKRFDPYSLTIRVGGKSASLDARAAGPMAVMIYTLGAVDDWQNRRKQEGMKTTKDDWRDVQEKSALFTALYDLSGSFILTTARRGPTTGLMQGLVDFRRYPDDPIAAIGADAAFSAMPAVPIIGTGIAKNLSDLFSQPIDNRTKEGAILANIPIVGPIVGQPALNAYGQRMGQLRVSEKLKKSFGLPFTLIANDSEEDTKLTSLTLKFGDGPTPITRRQVENEIKAVLTDEDWYATAKAFGDHNRKRVLAAYDRLDNMSPERFASVMSNYSSEAKKIAIREARRRSRMSR